MNLKSLSRRASTPLTVGVAISLLLVSGCGLLPEAKSGGSGGSSKIATPVFEDDFNRADGPVNADPNWTTMADPA